MRLNIYISVEISPELFGGIAKAACAQIYREEVVPKVILFLKF